MALSDQPINTGAGGSPPLDSRKFYFIDSTRATFREYMFETKNPLILLVAAFIKLFRINISGSTDDLNVRELTSFFVDESEVPQTWLDIVRPAVEELHTAGFGDAVYFYVSDLAHKTETVLAVMREPDGNVIARVHLRVYKVKHPPKQKLFVEYITELADGKYIWTLNGTMDMLSPPVCNTIREEKMPAIELLQKHYGRIAESVGSHNVIPANDLNELLESHGRFHHAVTEFHLKRGIFREPTPDDAKRIARLTSADKAVSMNEPGTSPHADILLELDKIQNQKQSSWTSLVLILLVSGIMFVAAGASSWGWETLVLIVPVLLFHEAGHWVAMKIFKYQNLKMFFIPFLGAAVSGRHYNVAGWKKAIVALAGPVPGIVVGIGVGIAGLITKKPMLNELAFMMLLLNGFNLLPILPLDGGQVMHAVLFCRHFLLDAIFRVVAVGVIFAATIFIGDRALMAVGIALAIGLPNAIKVARVAGKLRSQGLDTRSPDDKSIPAPVAVTIAEQLKTGALGKQHTKVLAQQTVSVFESLNARPPGVLASMGLLLGHIVIFGAAIAFTIIMAIATTGKMDGFFRLAANMPRQEFGMEEVQSRSVSPTTQPAQNRTTIVAALADSAEATSVSTSLEVPEGSDTTITQVGSVLFVAFPATRDELRQSFLSVLESKTKSVRVLQVFSGVVALQFIAPNEKAAAEIELELQEYFQSGSKELIQPWSPLDRRTTEEKSLHGKARNTYLLLTKVDVEAMKSADVKAVDAKIADAARRGDEKLRHELAKERQGKFKHAYAREFDAAVERLGADADAETCRISRELLFKDYDSDFGDSSDDREPTTQETERFNKIFKTQMDERKKLLRQIAQRCGSLTIENDNPIPAEARFSARGALVRSALVMQMDFLAFDDPAVGFPALIHWLDSKGCQAFRFDPPHLDVPDQGEIFQAD